MISQGETNRYKFQEVKLRSFSTAVHKVEAAVCYKAEM